MFFIFLLYRLYIFVISLNGYLYLRKGKQVKISKGTKLNNKYILLFPAFKEQKIVHDTCAYYEQWLANDERMEMIIIGDVNETAKPSTTELAVTYFAHSPQKNRFSILTCTQQKGSKASKVNFAINSLRKKYKQLSHVVIFDFDARPSWQDFLKADLIISAKEGQVYSFTPMIESKKTSSILLSSYLMNHLERVLVNELGNSLLPNYVRYPMGATMILAPDLWNFISNIPEPIDDIPLGYLLAKEGTRCVTLPFFTNVLATPDMNSLYRQYIPIYTGVYSKLSTLRQFNIPLTPKDYLIEFLCNIFTVFEFVAIFYSIVLILQHNLVGIIVLLVQAVANLIMLRKLSLNNILFGFIGYYVRLSLFIYFVWAKLFTRIDLSKHKTPR